jgi:hypothetical protein
MPMGKHEENLNISDFGTLTAGLNLKTEEILRSLRDEASFSPKAKLLSIDEINKVSKTIMDETSDGLMLYFGGQKVESQSSFYNESKTSLNLVQHMLLAFKTL